MFFVFLSLPAPMPLFPTQISHGLPWDWTWASSLRNWQLTSELWYCLRMMMMMMCKTCVYLPHSLQKYSL